MATVSALLAETATGLLLTVLANGALAYCGHLAARRFWPEARASIRLAATAVVFLTLVTAIFFLLSIVGGFTRWAVAIASLLLAAWAHARWGSHRDVGGELRRLAGWCRLVAASRGGLLLLGVAVLLAFAAGRGIGLPPLSYDALTDHAYVAGTWVQAGRLVDVPFPKGASDCAYFPPNFHGLIAWVMLPFHSDFLANLMNFPLLALAGVALYALCRELDLDVGDSSLAAGLVCMSPAMLAYVTTQYPDPYVAALLLAAALFMTRCLKRWSWPDAVVAFMACGLSVGAKHSAMLPAALVAVVTVIAAWRGDGAGRRRGLTALALCLAISVGLGGYRHVRNWLETGNPLFPMNVRVFGVDIFPGSPLVAAAESRAGLGGWRDDVRNLVQTASYQYGQEPTPLTWGPKLPALVVLALLSLWFAGRSRFRLALRVLALCWLVPTLFFYLDPSAKTVILRRFWAISSCRYLAMPVGLMAVSALAGLSLLRSARAGWLLRIALCGFLLYDLGVMCAIPDSPDVLALLGCALPFLLLAVSAAWRVSLNSRPRRALLWSAVVALSLLGAVGVQWVRDLKRNRFYATRIDLHGIPKFWAEGWAFCDDPRESRVIALASSAPDVGNRWFFYPLMGRRLQNRVLHVPVKWPRGGAPDPEVWLSDLRAAGVTHVFVQIDPDLPRTIAPGEPEPPEMAWIQARPETFEQVAAGEYYRIYRMLSVGIPQP